jgi:hypothetical protein
MLSGGLPDLGMFDDPAHIVLGDQSGAIEPAGQRDERSGGQRQRREDLPAAAG